MIRSAGFFPLAKRLQDRPERVARRSRRRRVVHRAVCVAQRQCRASPVAPDARQAFVRLRGPRIQLERSRVVVVGAVEQLCAGGRHVRDLEISGFPGLRRRERPVRRRVPGPAPRVSPCRRLRLRAGLGHQPAHLADRFFERRLGRRLGPSRLAFFGFTSSGRCSRLMKNRLADPCGAHGRSRRPRRARRLRSINARMMRSRMTRPRLVFDVETRRDDASGTGGTHTTATTRERGHRGLMTDSLLSY